MKKWIAVLIIILILIVNPSKSNTFNKNTIDGKNTKMLNQIELSENTKYIKYQEYIVLGQGRELVSINSKGKADSLLKMSKDIENFEIDSCSYIDILDKKDNRVTSIDSSGKTIFTDKVYNEILMYKSINKDIFVSVYKNENKDIVRIQDIEKNLIKEIEYSSKLTHINSLNDNFIVIDLNTDKGLYSKLSLYNTNGQLIKSCEFDEIVIDVICENNKVYLAFENKVTILDSKLNEEVSIKTNGIESLEKGANGQVFIVDNDRKIICIYEEKENIIKSKSEAISIEQFNKEYITYSEHSIFDKDNKEVVKVDEGIKDIIYIGDNTIGVYVDGFIKILRLF